MKIPLKLGQDGHDSAKAAQTKALEHDVLAAQKGDWEAKNRLIASFMPLLTSLAEKRSSEPVKINEYIDAGKKGLLHAADKYRSSVGADRFRIFALNYIEAAMSRAEEGGGFFSRLFGR